MSIWNEPPGNKPAAKHGPRHPGPGFRTPARIRSGFRRVLLPVSLPIAAITCGCSDEIDRSDEFGLDQGGGPVEVIVLDSSAVQYGETPKAGAAARGDGGKLYTEPAGSTGATAGKVGREDLLAGAVAYEPDGEFTVQVAVYSEGLKAEERVRELTALGYPAYAILQPDGKGFRVRIGYFRTREDARTFGEIFAEDHGSEFWIDRRVNER